LLMMIFRANIRRIVVCHKLLRNINALTTKMKIIRKSLGG